MYKTTRMLSLVTAFGAVLLVAGCVAAPDSGGSTDTGGQSDPAVAKLVANAKKAGPVTVYISVAGGPAQTWIDSFSKKYGIQTNMVRLNGNELDQRFQAEIHSSGGSSADVIVTTNPVLIRDAVTSGDVIPLAKADLPGFPWNFPERFLKSDSGSPTTLIEPQGIAYNTDLVKGKDIPTKWSDLLSPKWKKKVGMAIPTTSLSNLAGIVAIGDLAGDDFLEKLAAQQPKISASSSTANADLVAGEVLFVPFVTTTSMASAKANGAPIGIVIPGDTSGLEVSTGILSKAHNPDGARLFAMYSMSKEGAKVLADATGTVSPYDTANLPKNYKVPDVPGATAQVTKINGVFNVSK